MKTTFSREGVTCMHGSRLAGKSNVRGKAVHDTSKPTFCLKVLVASLSGSLLLASSVVSAESEVTQLTQGLLERVSFDVSAFSIQGDNPLSEAETRDAFEQYIGPNRGIDDIENAADALEQAIKAKGLSFYRVSFPPQELTDGVVDLLIKRYTIGNIEVVGNKHYSPENVKASLPVLQRGTSPSAKQIAQSLRLANQNSGKRVRVTLAPGKTENEIDANVSVMDQSPVLFSTWLNNTGTEVSGDYRVGVSAAHRNLFGRDHSASISFITSPEGIDDVQQFALNYKMPFYRLGGSLNIIAVESDVDSGTVGGVFDVAGRGEVFGLGYSQSLPSVDRYHQSVSLQLTDKLFDNDIQFQGNQVLEDVRSRPIALTYSGAWSSESGVDVRTSLGVSSNLSGGSFNNARSYGLSRVGASDDWQKYDLGVNVQYSKSDWIWSLATKFSVSSDRLITGEQFAVGGTNSIRGMEERELRGDEGYQLNFQAWAPEITKGLRPVAFVDYGSVENNLPIEGELGSESVISAGVLFNWNPTDKISASASYGYLIDGIDSGDELSEASRDGDSKVHFNLAYRF
ncbi:ShlB/FhaC/HecB family hemolysin secretion/activation protein [Arenicella xantha]|nr:ShlB/FhaC/HecB family hemolysin secretion/activation protein [Arenicella xantha]